MKEIFCVGLTGGIGSGKTTVANLFSELGITIINADTIARELVEPNSAAYQAIIEHFGESILKPDHSLNRAQLRQLIFKQPAKKKWLEDLLHPLIKAEIASRLQQISSAYAIVEIPLLVETGPYPFVNRILVVDTSEVLQHSRIQIRDKVSLDDAMLLQQNQISRENRLQRADDVIHNHGDLIELKNQVVRLHEFYLRK